MLKFKNRDDDGKEFLVEISMSSVQGGVLAEFAKYDIETKKEYRATILMTPMDAASFVYYTHLHGDLACRPVGHGADSTTLSIQKILWGSRYVADNHEGFVGDRADVIIKAGDIDIEAPEFVVAAMRLCVERMMESMFFPSTGSDEEEFG